MWPIQVCGRCWCAVAVYIDVRQGMTRVLYTERSTDRFTIICRRKVIDMSFERYWGGEFDYSVDIDVRSGMTRMIYTERSTVRFTIICRRKVIDMSF